MFVSRALAALLRLRSGGAGRVVLLAAALAAGSLLLTDQVLGAGPMFGRRSLQGTFAYVGEGDGPDQKAFSLGTIVFDGDGRFTRSLRLHAEGAGGRQVLLVESSGLYQVSADGTGLLEIQNQFSSGESTVVAMDLVIQDWLPGERRRPAIATRIFALQREPGVTVDLVSATMSRGAP